MHTYQSLKNPIVNLNTLVNSSVELIKITYDILIMLF